MHNTVQSLKLTKLPHYFEDNGDLVAVEGMINVPFNILRVFVVRAPNGSVRGKHAHRKCAQFLACSTGAIEVLCDDGMNTATFLLDHPNAGLLIPAGIWAEQTYRGENATLTVLCDQRYDEMDYIREYETFLVFRQKSTTG